VFGSSLKNGSELNRFVATDQTAASEARESSMSVMSDALALISNPKMRVSYSLSKDDDEIEDPNISVDKTKRAVKAKGKLLSNISKKHLVEILLPTLCHLKALLQKHKSPLFKDVMVCLLDVFQRHKNEAKECLANEPTTLQELEFDARQSKKNVTN
jgi:condensin-2 complex subunit D3